MSLSVLLRCHAIEQSRRFYEDVLKLRTEDLNEHSISVFCGDSEIMLTDLDLWQAQPHMSGTIYLGVVDVDAWFGRLQSCCEMVWPLQEMPYGTREFAIRDCNGYILAFVQKN
ncbi:VOC family protein [Undibacterium cyanobacteriorum]|uniref:VOC family protein n=1 Tax=Undibacterium cyanobacteriorum TaxID=3073561 RepID=A0ABY9RM96_9BURK|nr:VOC family protein [Undibacterium sp. 20NA77.5]WMW81400.1 VOC family protein [Undibacterium sp. 20NA77.5]